MNISNDTNRTDDLGIEGLRFQSHPVVSTAIPGWTRILSNTGQIVGHFVTHGNTFSYGERIGAHLGQIDQLTFVSTSPQLLTGVFFDFRADSPSFGRQIDFTFETSPTRKLIVPMGVGHIFRGIEGVVTRNDLLLFGSEDNPQWRIEDDIVFFPLEGLPSTATPLKVNGLPIPKTTSVLFYRMQSALMRGGRSSENVTSDSGAVPLQQRELLERVLPKRLPGSDEPRLGVTVELNSFFPVGQESWGVLPSTSSCVMDFCIVEASKADSPYCLHQEHDVLHTILSRATDPVFLDIVNGIGTRASYRLTPDERVSVQIARGVAYRYRTNRQMLMRVETEGLSYDHEGDWYDAHDIDTTLLDYPLKEG